jgi:hypothetical protein
VFELFTGHSSSKSRCLEEEGEYDINDEYDNRSGGRQHQRRKQSMTLFNMFISLMNLVFKVYIVIVVGQQLFQLNTYWQEMITARESRLKQWHHDCGDPNKPPMNNDIMEICNQLKVVVDSSPFMRALSKLVHSWNSCVKQCIHSISMYVESKILFLCIFFAVAHYLYKIFGFAKNRSLKLKDFWQTQYTIKELQKQTSSSPSYSNNSQPYLYYSDQPSPTIYNPSPPQSFQYVSPPSRTKEKLSQYSHSINRKLL